LLLQDEAGGLEVRHPDTGEWTGVEPNGDAYVVNIGDMMDAWTGGEYRSTVHRVVNRSGRDRYSVPFFFDGNPDTRLAPLAQAAGAEPAPRSGDVKILTVEEHMLERFGATYKLGNAPS
jgi:isopenicillin N synthase-like dioxygenase